MLIAREKAKNNVGEYLIYMFQIEDLIRACNFNHETIEKNLVSQYKASNEQLNEIKNWYLGLSDLMEEEKITQNGHLTILTNKINEVFEFHLFLLQSTEHSDYKKLYQQTETNIKAFAEKQQTPTNNIVNLMVNAIYGYYLLKLKNSEISKETTTAISSFSALLSALSNKFKDYEEGKIKTFED